VEPLNPLPQCELSSLPLTLCPLIATTLLLTSFKLSAETKRQVSMVCNPQELDTQKSCSPPSLTPLSLTPRLPYLSVTLRGWWGGGGDVI